RPAASRLVADVAARPQHRRPLATATRWRGISAVRRTRHPGSVGGGAVGSAGGLHLGLVDVVAAVEEAVADLALAGGGDVVVGAVEVLDDLEGPAVLDRVAAKPGARELVGE